MLKHVGRMANNQSKVIVAYRVVPGEADQSVIVQTQSLAAEEHDTLIKTVEGSAGQEADEFATVMARTMLPDGSNMLARFHTQGKMMKVPSDTVEMTPTTNDVINLAELNKIIAEQKGVTVADLALKAPEETSGSEEAPVQEATPVNQPADNDGVLSDADLAAQYRSQADSLFKEAKRLREQAEELVPTKKKSSKKSLESV
tara:strand:+ start:1220 stop:1822 length:603 start_codon:yes stop_codon:yes gene_type:complete